MRFIFQYTGEGTPSIEDIERVSSLDGLTILRKGRSSLLVQSDSLTQEALSQIHNWTVSPEITYEQPDPRPRLDR